MRGALGVTSTSGTVSDGGEMGDIKADRLPAAFEVGGGSSNSGGEKVRLPITGDRIKLGLRYANTCIRRYFYYYGGP